MYFVNFQLNYCLFSAFILEILKLGPQGPYLAKKVGTLQKNVGPQVTTHLIGHVSLLLALISLVSGLCDFVNH